MRESTEARIRNLEAICHDLLPRFERLIDEVRRLQDRVRDLEATPPYRRPRGQRRPNTPGLRVVPPAAGRQ